MPKRIPLFVIAAFFLLLLGTVHRNIASAAEFPPAVNRFIEQFCIDCHSGDSPAGALNIADLPRTLDDAEAHRRWVHIFDQIVAGKMPPAESPQPSDKEKLVLKQTLSEALIAGEQQMDSQTLQLRRLTRFEYENTIRDLFSMPGVALANNLPADGSAQGFDKHPQALDVSHVNIAKYFEAADQILDLAIAVRPIPPTVQQRRISLVNRGGFVAHVVMNGDGVLLKDKRPDPEFPPAGEQNHLDEGAHERWGSFENGAAVGLFRHEDESFNPYFIEHVTIYPGIYRVRTSLWSFQWDKGQVLPGRGTEVGRLSVVQLTGDGRGGQHPSYVLGYFDAPDTHALEHEVHVWLNHNELIGFNTASLAPVANYSRQGRALAFTGPGIAVDWLDIEGPLHTTWPPQSHKLLFADLPLEQFGLDQTSTVRPPTRQRVQQLGAGRNRPDPEPGIWTVASNDPLVDADRLLASFLPRLFRRPVAEEIRRQYVDLFAERLNKGDCFETAMRAAYRAALCAPDFLFHLESANKPDIFALACRLSYFLWNTLPDERLSTLAASGKLIEPSIWHGEVERLLNDPRSQRFVDDFLGQWLRLRQISSTDPDRKLYPEFSPYLQDSMLAESRAYFRHLIHHDLDVSNLISSDFLTINEKLSKHYGIEGVTGAAIRPVPLPADCPRGGFLTQGSILKVTANGTTTSPVPRGAFVLERLLGETPEPPPANVAAIEPDVRGTTTIREQLSKHRDNEQCAFCHQSIDPPGFALESFDVIGGFRDRYRSIGEGETAPRGTIDPFIPIGFKLGKSVDASGVLPDGRSFNNVKEFQSLLASENDQLMRNLARQLAIYSTGRSVRFADRPQIDAIVQRTTARQGGVRTLIHQLVSVPLFTGLEYALDMPTDFKFEGIDQEDDSRWMLMTQLPPAVTEAIRIPLTQPQPPVAAGEVVAEKKQRLRVGITGIFAPHRTKAFIDQLAHIPEVELLDFDYATSEANLAYAAESPMFNGASEQQIIERLDNRLRQLTRNVLGVKPPLSKPQDQLQLIEIGIVGLHCNACSLACYEILARVPGVERATADFTTSMATVLVDPAKVDREQLEKALTERGVELR